MKLTPRSLYYDAPTFSNKLLLNKLCFKITTSKSSQSQGYLFKNIRETEKFPDQVLNISWGFMVPCIPLQGSSKVEVVSLVLVQIIKIPFQMHFRSFMSLSQIHTVTEYYQVFQLGLFTIIKAIVYLLYF